MRSEKRYFSFASWEWLTSSQLPGDVEEWAFVLKGIVLQTCWTDRCTALYQEVKSPPAAMVTNRILVTFNDTLRAREQHLEKL